MIFFRYHCPMRKFESPYVADWFATSLRWIILVGLSILIAARGLNDAPLWVLFAMLLWNIVMSVMAGLSVRLPRYHRQIVLSVDFILAARSEEHTSELQSL